MSTIPLNPVDILTEDPATQSDGSISFSSNLAVADIQQRLEHIPVRIFIQQLIQYGFAPKIIVDLVNKDLSGYAFYTVDPLVSGWRNPNAPKPSSFYAGLMEWRNVEYSQFIWPNGRVDTAPPLDNAGNPYPEPWSLEIGPPSTTNVTMTPNIAEYINQGLIALLGSTDAWVQRHTVFDQPQGTLRALQGNKWPGYLAAYSMMNQFLLIRFGAESTRTLVGVTPVVPPKSAVGGPPDYASVYYNGDPATFPDFVKQVAKEWVDRQLACGFLGQAYTAAASASGHLFGMFDMLSPVAIDPPTKLQLAQGDYYNPLGHFPTYVQTAWGLMCLGAKPFGLAGDQNIQTVTVHDYEGVASVTSAIGYDTTFDSKVYEVFAARVGAWAALDKNHLVLLSNDIDGVGNPSKFGALLVPWKDVQGNLAYPNFRDPNQWGDLAGALVAGHCTRGQLKNLAQNGVFQDPAIKSELIDKPSATAQQEWAACGPNATTLLNAFLGKL